MTGILAIVQILVLLAGGVIATKVLFTKIVPPVGDLIEKITPYQSYIGIVIGIWGAVDLIVFLLFPHPAFYYLPLSRVFFILIGAVELLLGILLAMDFLKARKELKAESVEKLEKVLIPFRTPLGILSIIAGFYSLIFRIIWGVF
jgi:hypothetical protein